jgi:hypothetical protein
LKGKPQVLVIRYCSTNNCFYCRCLISRKLIQNLGRYIKLRYDSDRVSLNDVISNALTWCIFAVFNSIDASQT